MELSNEMDLAKIIFIWKVVIKERGAEVLRKIRPPPLPPPPIYWKPFKGSATPRTAIGIRILIVNSAHRSVSSLYLLHSTYISWQRR